ncbi:Transcripts altered in meiosis protein 6 [Hyphodiscus hymeniophilus]|uniref:Transcripts altered in meiosis protein 6 n=1 Tax=Hyphodiscus hymeniophilus TaxID=353542 RepID=A0A9P6VQ68_9HELO|nr:Transcripts altered in meiosis protein 6 [Hyphodiscus hymeniophilus]
MSKVPPLEHLSRPEPLHKVLAEQDKLQEDCLPCRVTGAAAFAGLGVYSYVSGHSQLKAQEAKILKSKSLFGIKTRQTGITGIALTLVGMGFWRLVN